MTRPNLLALTMGEPGSIASEITLAAWEHFHQKRDRSTSTMFFVIADKAVFDTVASGQKLIAIDEPAETFEAFGEGLPVLQTDDVAPLPNRAQAGFADPANATAVIASIRQAVDFALTDKVQGVVTNPIQKESLYDAGFDFQGHTDFLAHLAGVSQTVMMLSAKDLRTVPITVHIALKEVPGALSSKLIVDQTSKTASGLKKWFGIKTPRVGITGLNPHAGENGAMGNEETAVIGPAIAELRAAGLKVSDPLPADTVFHEEARAQYDVIMCMYHDQALIPVKTLDFHNGVNTTLGLPFIRTSPDHGTALSLAGTGKANPSSLIAAIEQAALMASNSSAIREQTAL